MWAEIWENIAGQLKMLFSNVDLLFKNHLIGNLTHNSIMIISVMMVLNSTGHQ